jgi:hypothetical protein
METITNLELVLRDLEIMAAEIPLAAVGAVAAVAKEVSAQQLQDQGQLVGLVNQFQLREQQLLMPQVALVAIQVDQYPEQTAVQIRATAQVAAAQTLSVVQAVQVI